MMDKISYCFIMHFPHYSEMEHHFIYLLSICIFLFGELSVHIPSPFFSASFLVFFLWVWGVSVYSGLRKAGALEPDFLCLNPASATSCHLWWVSWLLCASISFVLCEFNNKPYLLGLLEGLGELARVKCSAQDWHKFSAQWVSAVKLFLDSTLAEFLVSGKATWGMHAYINWPTDWKQFLSKSQLEFLQKQTSWF